MSARAIRRAVLLLALLAPARAMAAEPAPLTVGVLPLGGNAAPAVRRAGGEALVAALRAIKSLEVISLLDLSSTLGSATQAALEACTDDPCRLAKVKPLGLKRIAAGEVIAGEGGLLRLRLIDSSSVSAPVTVRVSREVPAPLGASLRGALIASAAELFPERIKVGTLIVETKTDGAAVMLDGTPLGIAPLAPVEVAVGPHQVRIEARGHNAHEERVEVVLGDRVVVRASLSKNRSAWPYYLLGSAAGVALIGGLVGLDAKGIADSWSTACPNGACQPGFTRARYEDDQSALSLRRGASNVLFGVGAGLLITAVVGYLIDPGKDDEASR